MNIGNIDFSQYQSWPVIKTPSGGVYYQVPNTGYVYDPFLSQAKKRPVLFTNPTLANQAQAIQMQSAQLGLKAQEAQLAAAQNQSSLLGQVGPLAAATAIPIGVKAVADNFFPSAKAQADAKLTSALADKLGTSASPTQNAFLNGAGVPAEQAKFDAFNNALQKGDDLGGSADGVAGGGGADAAPAGIGIGPYLGAGGAALGAYGLYNAIQNHSDSGAALSGAGLGLGLAEAAPLVGLGPVEWAGLGVAALGGALGGFGLNRLFGHESTHDMEKKAWNGLANNASDPNTQAYAQQYSQYLNSDQAKADAKLSFQDMKASGQLQPEQVWGGLGMFKTFGSDWLNKYSEDQRRQISQKLIDAGLLDQKHGDIVITDPDAAHHIADSVFNPSADNAAQPGTMAASRPTPGNMPEIINRTPTDLQSSMKPAMWSGPLLVDQNKAQQLGQALANRINMKSY